MEDNKRFVIREGYSGTVIEQSDDLGEVLDIYKGYFDPSIDSSELDGWQNDLDKELTKLNQWGIDTEVNGVDLDDFLEDCWETKDYYIEVVDIQFENDIKDKYNYYSNVKRMLKDFYGENVKITDKNIFDGKEAEVTESRYTIESGGDGEVWYETNDIVDAYQELALNVYSVEEGDEFKKAVNFMYEDIDKLKEEFNTYNLAYYLREHPEIVDNLLNLDVYVRIHKESYYDDETYIEYLSYKDDSISEKDESEEWRDEHFGISPERMEKFLSEHDLGENEFCNLRLSSFADKYYFYAFDRYYRGDDDYVCVRDSHQTEEVNNGFITEKDTYQSLARDMLEDYFGDLEIITEDSLCYRYDKIMANQDGFRSKIINKKLREMEEKAKEEIKYEEEQKKKETKRKGKGMSL